MGDAQKKKDKNKKERDKDKDKKKEKEKDKENGKSKEEVQNGEGQGAKTKGFGYKELEKVDVLPEGWEVAKEAKTGKQYFFNRSLNKTTWEHPTKEVQDKS